MPEQTPLQASDLCQHWSTWSFTKNILISAIISAGNERYGRTAGRIPSGALCLLG